jgi:hypothetical protein
MSMTFREVKLVSPTGTWTTGKIATTAEYHFIESSYGMKDELKAMKGAKWMGKDTMTPMPVWRVDNCRRNNFNLEYLEGKNPYARYKAAPDLNIKVRETRVHRDLGEVKIFGHQLEFTRHMLQKRQVVIAGEMGTGKTLALFEAAELSLVPEIWYVAPKSALASVQLERLLWGVRPAIRFMTYDQLKNVLAQWKPGQPPPTFVCFDECSRLKTPTSQRSQAAFYLAESMRDAYGHQAYIILMSGSPAPKSPLDWYWICEIACPGFLREGTIEKFRDRLAIVEKAKGMGGVTFPKVLGWRDGNTTICNICGKKEDDPCHDYDNDFTRLTGGAKHKFVPTVNEVNKLYIRMAGLTLVKMKKDCMDLPDKIYREVKQKPSLDMIRAARIVASKGTSAIESMTLLRELSDGFQYGTVRKEVVCDVCNGHPPETGCICKDGKKFVEERTITEVDCPKYDMLNDLLDENEDKGRLVVYAGFTASIDRICKFVRDRGWHYIRVDGRGWSNSFLPGWSALEALQGFQNTKSDEKFVFVGHPGSAGMGLTLTAASMIVYFSNDFNAESRIQSEDRIHRPGMDTNRGATIVDLIHLPTDRKVLLNLKRKRELQSITLNEIQKAMEDFDYDAPMVV